MQHTLQNKIRPKRKLANNALSERVLDLQLAEYERLYLGMLNQMDGIRQIVINSLLIAGVAIPVLVILVQQQVFVALLLTPIIFSSAAWMFQFHALSIFVMGRYMVNRLEKELNKNLIIRGMDSQMSIWDFDSFFSGEETKGWKNLIIRLLGSINVFTALTVLLLPGIVSLAIWYIVRGTQHWLFWESILFFSNLGLIVIVFIFAALSPYIAEMYDGHPSHVH